MRKILNRINALIQENRDNQKQIISQTKELEWASVYHDSIRGNKWLEGLPLNIGRWAGNYSFFYVLNRILKELKPNSILELGLGESTKFISSYLDNYLLETTHLVIEQDEKWKEIFTENFLFSERTSVKVCPIEKVNIKGFESNAYAHLVSVIDKKYDLYVVDGPQGTVRYSRYDLVNIAKSFNPQDEFIIIMDDFDRKGEKETTTDLLNVLRNKNIKIFENCYRGTKSVKIIATEKYKYAATL